MHFQWNILHLLSMTINTSGQIIMVIYHLHQSPPPFVFSKTMQIGPWWNIKNMNLINSRMIKKRSRFSMEKDKIKIHGHQKRGTDGAFCGPQINNYLCCFMLMALLFMVNSIGIWPLEYGLIKMVSWYLVKEVKMYYYSVVSKRINF